MLKRELSDWPGGVESVWPLLDAESIRALRVGTPPDDRALRVSSELEEEELAGSAFVGNAMVLLRAVAEGGEDLGGHVERYALARERGEVASGDDLAGHGSDGAFSRGDEVPGKGPVGAALAAANGAGGGADRAQRSLPSS